MTMSSCSPLFSWICLSVLAAASARLLDFPFRSTATMPKTGISLISRSSKSLRPSDHNDEPNLPSYDWDHHDHADDGTGITGMDDDDPTSTRADTYLRDADMGLPEEAGLDDTQEQTSAQPYSFAEGGKEVTTDYAASTTSHEQTNVIYRYFGKSRARLHHHDSIPFILLGPSVDHWKTVGQALAARGFSVMACEGNSDENDGASLVAAILDSMKWGRAILVGCDKEALLAIAAAIGLEERVAGLILCGDLMEVQTMLGKGHSVEQQLTAQLGDLPFSVIWDGSSLPEMPFSDSSFSSSRCLIRGGGSAPHRTLPEQFAWTLTRFVEENVAPISDSWMTANTGEGTTTMTSGRGILQKLFAPGSLLVVGRALAGGIMYITALKIAVYQFQHFTYTMSRVQSQYDSLSGWPRQILNFLGQSMVLVFGRSSMFRKRVMDKIGDQDFPKLLLPAPVAEMHEQELEEEEAPEESYLSPVPVDEMEDDYHSESIVSLPLLNPVSL